ncbi:DUF1080 domain-containing protein [Echinicola jeungdonensis]|uniref:DUF1080 domain-containing protein n=1 Tax=Echinicola jeungdonensis TaxID=709343 RepID=A0ABV5J5Q0_9BACT|nr:DUF1080 domain-containing protein [Echinicola jeungdonensis]MDN3668922.1 DUF1080 domain-containing protein [Echinicola jeungdonensis]
MINLFAILMAFLIIGPGNGKNKTESNRKYSPVYEENWEQLLDKNLSKWDKFMGVPHHSVPLEGVEKGDGKNGKPLGLNNDPLNVFSVKMDNGQPILKVTGEIYGGLSTKKEYENYHLSLKFKWGTEKYAPRLEDKRDSGILYHCQEPHGQFWNVWMRAPEMQVQESDCGDFHPLAGVSMDIKAVPFTENGDEFWKYDPQGKTMTFKSDAKYRRCRKSHNYEKPNGKWNHLELICIGEEAYHIVNGKVVMVLKNSKQYPEGSQGVTLTKGKIQLQSEGAELYYKEIKIRTVNELPREFAKQLK